ncbi:DNA binding protein [Mycobacterium phage Mendokysei]|uniref:Uncharacterized protein n=1 Tax=Mycobacterium phage Mendokysei TaxID=2099637 RepID=A0A2P1CG80_9CAUD|nr:DNA binding protein [Mycobacterium phage Mendokysei]AVJ50261.1 hypothetical protein SEA_MENDOKYSEI_45 [Mycobacterium phage Mendokysei]
MMNDAKAARAAAYRAGLCVDCKAVPYSAGRTRCETCFREWLARMTGGEK